MLRQAIEDDKQATELRRNAELFRTVGNAGPYFIFMENCESRMTYANPIPLSVVGPSWARGAGWTGRDWVRYPIQQAAMSGLAEQLSLIWTITEQGERQRLLTWQEWDGSAMASSLHQGFGICLAEREWAQRIRGETHTSDVSLSSRRVGLRETGA